MSNTVVIDCFPSSVARYVRNHSIVAIDVVRATTVAITALAEHRRCFIAADASDAISLRNRIGDALLAGELNGDMPHGFDMNNSPADLVQCHDVRPLVMLSTSGTTLMLEASKSSHLALVACFRNFSSVARRLIDEGGRVAIIGAGSRNEFREEDQMGCAWVAELLVEAGFQPLGQTSEIIRRWSGAPAAALDGGNSVKYLDRTGQLRDRDFIISHVDDLDLIGAMRGNELVRIVSEPGPREERLGSGDR